MTMIVKKKKAKLCHIFPQQFLLVSLFKEVHHFQIYVTVKENQRFFFFFFWPNSIQKLAQFWVWHENDTYQLINKYQICLLKMRNDSHYARYSGKSTALQIRRTLIPALIILVTLVKSFSLSMLVFLSMFLKVLWEEIVIIACLTVFRVVYKLKIENMTIFIFCWFLFRFID